MRERPRSVFVPYELKGTFWEKCDDLPRFLQPPDVIRHLQRHAELASRRLDWVESFEKSDIEEYLNYVGEEIIRRIVH